MVRFMTYLPAILLILLVISSAFFNVALCEQHDKLEKFVNWLTENEAFNVDQSPLQIKFLSGDIGYGITAKVNISKGEELFAVPKKTSLGVESAFSSDIGDLLRNHQDLIDEDNKSGTGAVLLHIMYEKFYKKETSFFWPYLTFLRDEGLPSFRTVSPLYYKEEEIQALQCSFDGSFFLPMFFRDFNTKYLEFESRFFLKYPELFGNCENSLESCDFLKQKWKSEFKWSFIVMKSRGFSPRITPGDSLSIVPLADLVNHREEAHFLGGRAKLLDESLNPEALTEEQLHTLEKKITHYVLVADRDYFEGDELFLKYHSYAEDAVTHRNNCNIMLLLNYGFVIDDRQHDCLTLKIGNPPGSNDEYIRRMKHQTLNSIATEFNQTPIGDSSSSLVVTLFSTKSEPCMEYLLRIGRVLSMTEADLPETGNMKEIENIFLQLSKGKSISTDNEVRMLMNLNKQVAELQRLAEINKNMFLEINKGAQPHDEARKAIQNNIKSVIKGEFRMVNSLVEFIKREWQKILSFHSKIDESIDMTS